MPGTSPCEDTQPPVAEHVPSWRTEAFTSTLQKIHELLEALYPRKHARCARCHPAANPGPALYRKPSIPPRHERRWNRWKKKRRRRGL